MQLCSCQAATYTAFCQHTWSNNYNAGGNVLSQLCGTTGAVPVDFTAADACDNTVSTSATFTIVDTQPPQFLNLAFSQTVECDGQGNNAERQQWLTQHGGSGPVTEVCSSDSVTWTNNFVQPTARCGATSISTVTFTVTDACSLASTSTSSFIVADTLAPTITTAASDYEAPCNILTRQQQFDDWTAIHGGASANDTCSEVLWSFSVDWNPGNLSGNVTLHCKRCLWLDFNHQRYVYHHRHDAAIHYCPTKQPVTHLQLQHHCCSYQRMVE